MRVAAQYNDVFQMPLDYVCGKQAPLEVVQAVLDAYPDAAKRKPKGPVDPREVPTLSPPNPDPKAVPARCPPGVGGTGSGL